MPSVPVPYTQNWEDYFGAQSAPINQEPAFNDVIFTGGGVQNGNELVLNFENGTGNYIIVWNDGSAPESVAITSATHTYTRNGAYRVEIHDSAHPDNLWQGVFVISDPTLYPDTTGPGGAPGVGDGIPDPPVGDSYDDYGPFPMLNGGTFTVHKHKSDPTEHEVGFNVDDDPTHELRVPLEFLPTMGQLSQESYDAIRSKLIQLGMGDIGERL